MSRNLRRLIPSPAMIVAVVALVMSLGGSAYALVITGKSIRNGSVTNKDIRNHTLTGNDVRRDRLGGGAIRESSLGPVSNAGSAVTAGTAAGLTHWAVVSGDGRFVRGRGQVATGDPATRNSVGIYQVVFNRDVRACGYVATIGNVSTGGPNRGQISVASLPSSVNGVRVRTANDGGVEIDRPFHLAVIC